MVHFERKGQISLFRGVLIIVRARNNIIKADFMHTKRTAFPSKMKIGIHLGELKYCTKIGAFLVLECSSIRKISTFENTDLYQYRTNSRKRYFDALSCHRTRYTFIWRTREHSNTNYR